jgi:rare lipoprotein A (peptidoglycan hydrolase)
MEVWPLSRNPLSITTSLAPSRLLGRLCALAAAAALAASLGAPAWAAPARPSAADLKAKKEEASRVRAELAETRKRLASEIADSERVSSELADTRRQAAQTSAKLVALEAALARQQSNLNSFAVHSYRSGGADTLAALLGASSFDDLVTRYRYVSLLGTHSARIVVWVKNARAESRRLKASLASRSAQLSTLKTSADEKRARIQDDIQSQQSTLDSLSADVNRMVAQEEKASTPSGLGGTGTPEYDGPAGGGNWMSMSSLAPGAYAKVEGRRWEYLVPSGVPDRYNSAGVEWNSEASRYSVAENGTGTSSGRPLNDGELTCAHKTLPMGTLIAVSYHGNHIIVVVTDRGPFSPPGRDIDLSVAAARALGIDGTGHVHEEIVTPAR